MLKYLEFINENNSETYTGEWVADHIKDITPEEEDIPNYFIDKFVLPNTFILTKIDIEDLLETDADFKEYFDHGNDRYKNEETNEDDLEYPIVVVNGEVMDGYNRATVLYSRGIREIEAYINI